jgi:hypothetical protein
METLEFNLSRKVGMVDMAANFKVLNEMLEIKFG